jgi:hypothetical protein
MLKPDAPIQFINQDGLPITIGPKRVIDCGSDLSVDQESDPTTNPDVPFDFTSLKPAAAMKPLSTKRASREPLLEKKSKRSSDANGAATTNSTAKYRERHPSEDYVGFEVIKPQIEQLLTKTLWKNRPLSDFAIEKLPGGSYNRVVAVQVKVPTPVQRTTMDKVKRRITKLRGKLPEGELARFSKFATVYTDGDFILRIPRLYRSSQASYDFEADFVMHDFVADLGVNCPKILHHEGKDNGVVPFPYLLQEKIPGKQLGHLWGGVFNQKQRLEVAAQLGTICRKMTSQIYPVYGKLLTLGPVYKDKDERITRHVRYSEPTWLQPKGSSKVYGVAQILQQGLVYHFRSRRSVPLQKMCEIVQRLDEMGAFGSSDGWFFAHGDFYPRNIMADIDKLDAGQVTSVLDWDMASFQPAVVACKPPSWLWQWSFYCYNLGDEDNLDIIAGEIPCTEDEVEIKKAFDAAAGSEYCRIAYHPYAYTARKLALWAGMGGDNRLGSSWIPWVSWWVNNWETFEDRIRKEGFPHDRDNKDIMNPVYLPRLQPAGVVKMRSSI